MPYRSEFCGEVLQEKIAKARDGGLREKGASKLQAQKKEERDIVQTKAGNQAVENRRKRRLEAQSNRSPILVQQTKLVWPTCCNEWSRSRALASGYPLAPNHDRKAFVARPEQSLDRSKRGLAP